MHGEGDEGLSSVPAAPRQHEVVASVRHAWGSQADAMKPRPRRRSHGKRRVPQAVSSDTGVERLGDSLEGRRVVLGVSGGIAAVDTVRLAREFAATAQTC